MSPKQSHYPPNNFFGNPATCCGPLWFKFGCPGNQFRPLGHNFEILRLDFGSLGTQLCFVGNPTKCSARLVNQLGYGQNLTIQRQAASLVQFCPREPVCQFEPFVHHYLGRLGAGLV